MNLASQTNVYELKGILVFNPKFKGYGTDGVRYCIHPTNGVLIEVNKSVADMLTEAETVPESDNWETVTDGSSRSVIPTSADLSITALQKGTHFLANTGCSNITLPATVGLKDGFTVSISYASTTNMNILVDDNADLIQGVAVVPASIILYEQEFYQLTYQESSNTWFITMKEINPIVGEISHLVGFGVDGSNDMFIDIVALVPNAPATYDLADYNLAFEDGTDSWKIVTGAVSADTVNGFFLELDIT